MIYVTYYRNGKYFDWLSGTNPKIIKQMIEALGTVQNLKIEVR